MDAGAKLLISIMLLATALAAPCDFKASNVIVGNAPGCPDGEPLNEARVYIHEEYYICGELEATGTLTAYEPAIMENQSVEVLDGKFELHGLADTDEHKAYYISVNHSTCELEPMILEVKNKCDLVAPAVQILPENAIKEGDHFIVEVASAGKSLDLTLKGAGEEVTVTVGNEPWKRSLSSIDCCKTPPCSCLLSFDFAETKHPICQDNTTSLKLTVNKPSIPQAQTSDILLISVIVFIIIAGTIAVLFLHSKK